MGSVRAHTPVVIGVNKVVNKVKGVTYMGFLGLQCHWVIIIKVIHGCLAGVKMLKARSSLVNQLA